MSSVSMLEHLIQVQNGALFARSWHPRAHDPDFSILLFHDSLGCCDLWRHFPERLASATSCRVITYDRLGFGRSTPFPGKLPPTFIADEANTIVPVVTEALDIKRFAALGHSVGGGMATETAAAWPTTCVALVTLAAQAFVEHRTLDGVLQAKQKFRQPGTLEKLQSYHGTKARWVLDAWTDTWLDPTFPEWTLDRAIAQVRCPTLCIHGDQDQYGSSEHPHRIAGSHGTVALLPGVGHLPHREDTHQVIQLICDFLAQADLIY